MNVDFVVHNASEVPVAVLVDHDGTKVQASIQCLEVELVSQGKQHGSLTLRFTGAEFEEAKEKFKAGETVSWNI